ncbi:hypothetical protein H4687_007484 [Streptomyces stelliscabiei]|uniref:Regulatory protein n=1 Tax=Streptomyces stelliscabiei TaxID=146820 RepID=A0A8I0TTP1_9ACTN|nr:hypothetical protein [Streptomyces stelliscabiei]
MDAAAQNEGQDPLADRLIRAGSAFEGSGEIAEARGMARDFLTTVQAVHGLPVSERAMSRCSWSSASWSPTRGYAPGPCLLDLEIIEGAVQISVWDSSTTLPSIQAADPERVGQHGLESPWPCPRRSVSSGNRWASGSPRPSSRPTTPVDPAGRQPS